MARCDSRSALLPATTLVELTIAIAIMVVIFAAVVPIVRAVRTNWDARQASADQVQNARILFDHIHRNLITATAITAVSQPNQTDGFIEYDGSDGKTYRYQLAGGNIQYGQVGDLRDLAGPFGRLRIQCFCPPDLQTPITDVDQIGLVRIEVGTDSSRPSWSMAVSLRVEPQTEFSPGVAVKQDIDWMGGCIDSYRSSQGPYNPDARGTSAVISTNSNGAKKIELSGGTIVWGDAYVGPNGDPDEGIKTYDTACITGTQGVLEQDVEIPDISAPGGMPSSEGPLILLGGTMTISTNRHFSWAMVWGDCRLVIDGDLTIQIDQWCWISGAEIEIPQGSRLRMYVGDWVLITSGAMLNASYGTPSNLMFYMYGHNETFSTWGSSQVYAVLQNPRGSVQVWTPSQFFGKIKADNIWGNGQIHVDLDAGF